MSLVRCTKCVMPTTRPDGVFDAEGVCAACRAYERRGEIDWDARRARFLEVISEHRRHPAYDCVIGSSGGKDSTYIVLKALELGLRPLVVTATTDILTDIGRRNLLNVRELGVDTLEFTPDPVVRRKIMRIALRDVGDIEWAEHCAIFGLPLRVAQDMGIGVVLYGENPQNEYSAGAAGAHEATVLDQRWREEYGGLLGLRPSDLVGREGITERDVWSYRWPEQSAVPVFGVFLGQFCPWDGWKNALLAQSHGFETWPTAVPGNGVNYESLDNATVGIHDRFKFLKYGFGRASDLASLHIRRGRMTREEGLAFVRRHDGRVPRRYLGYSLLEVLDEIDVTVIEYFDLEDRFANRAILEKVDDADQRWAVIDA